MACLRLLRFIAEIRDNPNITTSELHQILGISETAVEDTFTFLKKDPRKSPNLCRTKRWEKISRKWG